MVNKDVRRVKEVRKTWDVHTEPFISPLALSLPLIKQLFVS